jgi:RNA polymerase sigma factor (sigma-70 family)
MLRTPRSSAEPRRFPQSAAAACPTRSPSSDQAFGIPQAVASLLVAPEAKAKDAAWAAFVEAYTPLLLHAAREFGGGYDDAMDRYAYLLEHLRRDDYHRLRSFAPDGTGRFTTWLVVVARRLLQDHHRARYGRTRRAIPPGTADSAAATMRRNLVEMIGEEISSATLADGAAASPDTVTQSAERAEAVRVAVSSLDMRDQLLLKLRYEHELEAGEIAAVMSFSTRFHVYRRLRAVLRLLSRRLHPAYADAAP